MQISKINNNNVNFRSNINLIDSRKYFKVTEKLESGISFVDFPWTPKDIVKGQRAITEDIKSCTAGGIIVEGINKIREVVMFHLNPDLDDCKDFNKVEKALTLIEIEKNSSKVRNEDDMRKSKNYFNRFTEYLKNTKFLIGIIVLFIVILFSYCYLDFCFLLHR